jgi:hypothetical protein
MMVFWKARLVLLAVPKTGSTALEAAFLPHADAAFLHPPGLKHCPLRRWEGQVSRIFDRDGDRPLETMAVMREPLDWLASWHRYRSRPALDGHPRSTKTVPFAEFVSAWLEDAPPDFARVGRQSRFLSDAEERIGIDRLFRHDRLGEAVDYLNERLGAAATLSRRNVSPKSSPEALDPTLAERLRHEAASDFALWDALCAGRSLR